MADDVVISVRGLTKRFGRRTAVRNLDLDVGRGEIVGFLGPNGSGKTTAIRMMCGLLTPDEGEGRCLGFDIRTRSDDIRPRIGYLTQKFSLYDDLSVAENLEFIARMYDIADRRAVIAATIARFDLGNRTKQTAGSLSGGWKQRLALAGCLMHRPSILFLDEPTAGVDPVARRMFWDEIQGLASDGLSVLVSTHYMDEAERCNRLAYIAYGDLLADDTPAALRRASGLHVAQAEGDDLASLARLLAGEPAVDNVLVVGNVLRATGTDREALERLTTRTDLARWRWLVGGPALDEVFLELVARKGALAEPARETVR